MVDLSALKMDAMKAASRVACLAGKMVAYSAGSSVAQTVEVLAEQLVGWKVATRVHCSAGWSAVQRVVR